jgi:hypothetical protein
MKRAAVILVVACVTAVLALAQQTVNPDSAIIADFSKRVAAYIDLHKKARAEGKGLKPTRSPEEITHYEHQLAHRIRKLREDAHQGAIFTPEISAEFRRLLGMTMQGNRGTRVQQSLNHAEPVHLPTLRVNNAYPEGVPLQSTPPTVLANLPTLPPEVEYRVVGHDLVLRDVDANLVVDILHNVIP